MGEGGGGGGGEKGGKMLFFIIHTYSRFSVKFGGL